MKNTMLLLAILLLALALAARAEFVLKECPAVGCLLSADSTKEMFSYKYDDSKVIIVEHEKGQAIRRLYNTDDVYWSTPLKQIATFAFESGGVHRVKVKLLLSEHAGVMKSRRAEGGEAILGQLGNPLIRGVAGVYDMDRDFLLEWNCDSWEWIGERMTRETNGTLSCSFTAVVSNHFFNFVFRPYFYNTHLGFRGHEPWVRRINSKSMNGWCSWPAYFTSINAEKITQTADFIAEKFLPYGMNFLQVDNGYTHLEPGIYEHLDYVDSWICSSAKFPGGARKIAELIRARGLEPGIWFNPDFYNYELKPGQRDVICRDVNGRARGSLWIKHMPDMSDYTITNYYVPVFNAFRKAGFKYLKIDGLRHILFEGLNIAYEPKEAQRRLRNFALAARVALGDDVYLLGCWGMLTEIAGTFDACRISLDSLERWFSAHKQMFHFAEFFSSQRIVYLNDPDHIVMHADPEWSRMRVSTISLGGGLLTYGDRNEDMNDELVYMLQRGLPSLETRTAECGEMHFTYPTCRLYNKKYRAKDISEEDAMEEVGPSIEPDVQSPFSTLWAQHIEKPYEIWCVAVRNGVWSLDEDDTPLEKLGLDPGKTYLGYDFWKRKFLGEVKGKLHWNKLKFGHTEVVALREKLDRPQFLASTRHVSMDAVSVKDIVWKEGTLTLSLDCVENTAETYSFYIPAGFELKKVECEGGEAKGKDIGTDRVLDVEVKSQKKNVGLRLSF